MDAPAKIPRWRGASPPAAGAPAQAGGAGRRGDDADAVARVSRRTATQEVPVEVRVTVVGADAADQLRSLREWLGHTPELRGRVAAVEGPPLPGTLGPVLDALAILLAPGGVAAALAPAVLSWLRDRRGEVTVRITRPDGSLVEFTATRVAGLTGAELRAQVERLVRELDAAGHGDDGHGDRDSDGDGESDRDGDGDGDGATIRRPEGSANP